jgi:hypothetical protein
MSTNSQKLHSFYKDAEMLSLQESIDELTSSSIMSDVSVHKIVEAMNNGAVQLEDLDPWNDGQILHLRFADDTYHFVDTGGFLTDEDSNDYYVVEAFDALHQDVFEEYLARISEEDEE